MKIPWPGYLDPQFYDFEIGNAVICQRTQNIFRRYV